MDPNISKVAFNLGILIVILCLISLPFLDMNSAEFVVNILALLFSIAFLIFVTYDIRKQAKAFNKKMSSP